MVGFSASFWRLKGPRVTKILKLLKFRFSRARGSNHLRNMQIILVDSSLCVDLVR